jgi:hypothetical protein
MRLLRRSPTTAGCVALAVMLGLRLLLAVTTDGYLGVDGGAYRLSFLSVLGLEHTGADFTRPPLAPGWLLWPTTALFGPVMGYNLFSALFSMLLPASAWVLARALLPPWKAVAVLVLVGFDWLLTSMIVTGVAPLIGFSFILLSVRALWDLSSGPSKLMAALLVVSLPLIVLTNQTSAGLAALVLPLTWAVLPGKQRTTVPLLLGAALCLTALPWYLDATPLSGKLTHPGPLAIPHNVWEHQLWLGIIALFVAGKAHQSFTWVKYQGTTLATVSPAYRACIYVLAFLAVLQMFASFNEVVMNLMFRATYLMMPFLWLLAVSLVKVPWDFQVTRKVAVAGSLALVLLMGVSVQQFQEQSRLSALANGPVVAAFGIIPTGSGTVVTNNYSMALYLAADTQRPVQWTNWTPPPPYYAQADYEARCTMGWVSGCAVPTHVTHVLVDEKWPLDAVGLAPKDLLSPYGAPERRPWGRLHEVPWLRLVYENETVKLYEVETS